MLSLLRVHNFVLLEKLELELAPGFNVVTGETGAGKSIVVGALSLVLGGRARVDMLRPGAKQAEVEALFEIEHPTVLSRLAKAGIECDGQLIIRRVIARSGKSTRGRCYINGRLCTVSELQALAAELADITSQHEGVALTDASRHLRYLDSFAGLDTRRTKLAEQVGELRGLIGELRELHERERGRTEREDFLQFQRESIDVLDPQPGELDELDVEVSRLKHAAELRRTSMAVAEGLESDDGGLCDQLGRLVAQLDAAAALDAGLRPTAGELEQCWSQLRDIAQHAAHYSGSVESDPNRLEQAQERSYQLRELMRKHGPTLADVLAAKERIETELAGLQQAHTRMPELEEQRRQLLAKAAGSARKLSKERRRAARDLGAAISHELASLGMGKARVVVDVSPHTLSAGDALSVGGAASSAAGEELNVDGARLGRDGIDRVQFLIAPNRGMEPRPLARIASGGELSRALLALKRALGATGDDGAAVQVFDEVDAGVGGATADKIGRAIAAIGGHRQVLCITHLASIAAYADAHYVVSKQDDANIASSAIRRVHGKERSAELARMLTGERVTKASMKAARELLAEASAALAPAAE